MKHQWGLKLTTQHKSDKGRCDDWLWSQVWVTTSQIPSTKEVFAKVKQGLAQVQRWSNNQALSEIKLTVRKKRNHFDNFSGTLIRRFHILLQIIHTGLHGSKPLFWMDWTWMGNPLCLNHQNQNKKSHPVDKCD